MRQHLLLFLTVAVLNAPALGQEKTILKHDGWGSLSGRVTFEGDLPEPVSLLGEINDLKNAEDKACCKAAPAAQKVKQNWVIDKNRGVANVFVWIKPPSDKVVFPIHKDDKERKDTIVMDQPFCAFEPRVVALFPEYHDGSKIVKTGQKFMIKNSSIVPHNVRGTPSMKYGNDLFNHNIPSKSDREYSFKPQPNPFPLVCDLHKFMAGYVAVFNHPYFAVTKADGTFEIPRVPAGVEVTLMAWHEVTVLNALDVKGKNMTFKEGKNTFDFKITK
jgi:hypothetical protein